MARNKKLLYGIITIFIYSIILFQGAFLISITHTAFADLSERLICGNERDQQAPVVTYSDSNSYLIVWQDYRSGISFDIYGAGAYEGEIFGPFPICTVSRDQKNPALAWDGVHYVVVWEDNRSGDFYDIYGVRVAKSGVLLDGQASSSGRKISSASKNQINTDITWNGKDCFLVIWEDYRNSDADIYGMRVNPELSLFDGGADDGGIPICVKAGEQESPAVAWNGETFLVVWEDHVSAEVTDIRGIRISPAGNVLDNVWDGGIAVSKNHDIQKNPDAASDGRGFLVVWDIHTTALGYPDIYGITLTREGHVSGNAPIPLSTSLHNQVNPTAFWTGNNYICFWKDDRKGTVDVYWTRLDPNGRLLNSDHENAGNSLGLTRASCIYTPPAAAFKGAKGIVAWEENYTGQLDIYGMELIPPIPPMLSWVSTSEYESDGVDPDRDLGGASFTFKVSYKDMEGTPPQISQVWIDINGDNAFTFPDDRKVDMGIVSEETAPDYARGVIYQAVVPLEYKGAEGVGYRFYFKDNLDEATGTPAHLSYVMVDNNPPVLRWSETEGYFSDGVDPDQAEGSFTFKFMVNYCDVEGDVPEVAEVWIDWDDSAAYEQRERFVMQEADQKDIKSGRNYKKAVKILYAGDGKINYRFLFTDGFHLASGDPNQEDPAKNHTLTVQPHLMTPILSWPYDQGFEKGVKPGIGSEENVFTFKVGYCDPDNDVPVTTQVWVDLNGDRIFTEDERFKMAIEGPQTNDFTRINYYIKKIPISFSGEGEMWYRFVFDDGWNIATGEPFLDGSSIIVQSPLTLLWSNKEGFKTDGVNPNGGERWSSFEFRVVYMNKYGYPPVLKEIWLDENLNGVFDEVERYMMEDANAKDITYTDGKEYVKIIQYKSEKTGLIPYKFVFSDIYMTASGLPSQEGLSLQILAGDADAIDPSMDDPLSTQMLEAKGKGCFIKILWPQMAIPVEAGISQDDRMSELSRSLIRIWIFIFKCGLGIVLLIAFLCFLLLSYKTAKGR